MHRLTRTLLRSTPSSSSSLTPHAAPLPRSLWLTHRTLATVAQKSAPPTPKPINPLPKSSSSSSSSSSSKPSSSSSVPPSPSSSSSTGSSESESILQRIHRSLPRPPPTESGEQFTTLSGGGWKQKGTWNEQRKRYLGIMFFAWPAMLLTGLILYKRLYGSPEEKARWLEYERMMRRSAGLPVEEPKKPKEKDVLPTANASPAEAKPKPA